MTRTSSVSIALVSLASLVVGCGDKTTHPPGANQCPTDANCLGVGGPVGGGTPDGGTTDATIDDGGEAGVVDIHAGEVRNVTSFTQDPAVGVLSTETSLFVKGAQGAKFVETAVSGGTFVLAGLDNTFPALNFVYLESRVATPAAARTIFGFPVAAGGGEYDIQIPSFPANLAQTHALALGVPLTGGVTTGTATIVVQILDDKGVAMRNVFGDAAFNTPHPAGSPGANPYYDDGSDGLVQSTTGSGARGTIVWLAQPPGAFDLKLRFGAITAEALKVGTIGATADAVTFIRMRVTL